jgi:2-hydroxychromene-2-carboxylate isomerase
LHGLPILRIGYSGYPLPWDQATAYPLNHRKSNMPTAKPLRPAACLEFWFDFASNYSYLSVMRIEALAQAAGIAIAWRPFLLGPIFRELGFASSPFVLHPAKGRYVWRDMERQAQKYGLGFRMPSDFPRRAILPMRVAVFAQEEPWIGAFCQAVMVQNFVLDLDIDDPANVRRALTGLVPEPEAILLAAQTDANKQRLRLQTAEAMRRGLFGAPTFFANDEMFWGNDRLEDAIACSLTDSMSDRQ